MAVLLPGVKFDRYAGMLAEELDLNSVAFYRDAPLELKVDESAFHSNLLQGGDCSRVPRPQLTLRLLRSFPSSPCSDLLEKWRDSSVQGKNEQEIKNTLEKSKLCLTLAGHLLPRMGTGTARPPRNWIGLHLRTRLVPFWGPRGGTCAKGALGRCGLTTVAFSTG